MATTKKSTDVNLTVFQILEALTGELPCHASPNWEASGKKEYLPKQDNSAMPENVPEEASLIFFALTQEDAASRSLPLVSGDRKAPSTRDGPANLDR